MNREQDRVALAFLEARGPDEPGLDLGPVLRARSEPLRLHELRREAFRRVGDALVADVQVGERRRRARRVHERAVLHVEAVDDPLAADQQLGLARAVRRHRVDVDAPTVLDAEHDPVLVPDGFPLRRVRPALAIEALGQDRALPRGEVDHRDLRVAPPDPRVGCVPVRDARSVRRPDGIVAGAVAVRQQLRLPALGRKEVKVRDELRVPVVAARRREDELRAVGRPDRRAVILLGVGELTRLRASVCGDDEDLRATIGDPAFVVELVEEVRDPARRPPALVLFLRLLVAHA